MSSEVEICNNALLQLGEEPIISLDDVSKKARLCKRFYPDVRDAVLRAYPWRCATAFQKLGQLTGTDALVGTGFTYTYQLPVDPYCLRALLINNSPSSVWQVHGRKLVTDEGSVTLKYISRLTDPNDFDSLLKDVISCRLAQMIAYPITGNPNMTIAMEKLYEIKIMEARSVDSMEGSSEQYESNDLIDCR